MYPLVNISATAQQADLAGHWKIHVGDEATVPLSHTATHGKVIEALENLASVGRVIAIDASMRAFSRASASRAPLTALSTRASRPKSGRRSFLR